MNILRNRNEIITYTVDKNINNNLYISVQNGEVIVQAPWYFSKNQIQEIVDEKKRWILQKLREYEAKKEEYISGGIVKILGKDYTAKIRYRNRKLPKIDFEDRIIKIELPKIYKKVDNTEMLTLLTQKMYNVIAEKRIENTMEKIRLLLGYAPEDYELARMKNVLGKCSKDQKITINPDIVKYRQEIIDYVVLHQFVHLKYKTHSKRFYETIKKYMPNYEEYEKEINSKIDI
mgnify:CR=1 FL=1